MEKITVIESTAVPLPMANVDTDQIIPARFLKATTRTGFGENLFRDWRFLPDGQPNHSFALNQHKGSVLVAGHNFGCGSSREHAAWALFDYGFRVVISTGFADIFKGNALNNGLLPVEVSKEFSDALFAQLHANPNTKIIVDLAKQTVKVPGAQLETSFSINAFKKELLLNGFDEISYLISLKQDIASYELKRGAEAKWSMAWKQKTVETPGL